MENLYTGKQIFENASLFKQRVMLELDEETVLILKYGIKRF